MRATGIDHVVVMCSDVEKTLGWWRDELGLVPLRLEEWRNGQVPFPSVRVNDATIVDFLQGTRTGENYNHVALTVDVSRDELAAMVDQRGWDVAIPINDTLFGARGIGAGVYIRDPEGNVVELRTYDVARS